MPACCLSSGMELFLGRACSCVAAAGTAAAAAAEAAAGADAWGLRLCTMCALTSWLAASAAMRLSSPASTAEPTICASLRALSPGLEPAPFAAPRTPQISRQPACAGRCVPPPTVPTSTLGMVTLTCRDRMSSAYSMMVRQLLLSTFCAGSCPVARNTAVTMLAACALNPPTLPAMAEPMWFFCLLVSIMSYTELFSTDLTMFSGMIASTTMLLPRPRIQLIAAGFLSVHILPEMATSTRSGNSASSTSMALRHPLETMFMPIASPDMQLKRR
mmetsp:Transcript_63730/g.132700  ORF Transcript_63730/g.132700 Transcript_63730/m.132700 type:complete len:273 (-) Transcript_63730:1136-1954(-)